MDLTIRHNLIDSALELFSPLGKLAGRAIYFTDVFSLFFFIFFLVVAPGATLAQKPMVRSSPKF